jgi:DNA-binding response OmpR family regulator
MRLLLIEDNEELARLVANGLAAAGFKTDVMTTADEAEAALRTVRFAAVILDLGLPDEDGLAVLRRLRARNDPTPVLILTARGGVQDRVTGLRSGADDYLAKPFALEELVARLQALLRRPGGLLGTSLRVGDVRLDADARQVYVDDRPMLFAPREIAVLELLMRRAGRVVPKKSLEEQLSGFSSDVSPNAVEVYVSRLRKQLSEIGANMQIHTIRGVGYLVKEA